MAWYGGDICEREEKTCVCVSEKAYVREKVYVSMYVRRHDRGERSIIVIIIVVVVVLITCFQVRSKAR